MLYPELKRYIEETVQEFNQISEDRQSLLSDLSSYIKENQTAGNPVQLTFICTHNSRRSHISQIWAQTAAAFYGIPNIYCYSGGTEATAFHPNAVAAMQRSGFTVDQTTEADNPIYHVHLGEGIKPITAFSKVYNQAPNPTGNYGAIMTCSSADDACPIVQGAAKRIPIRYDDPKAADNTSHQTTTYDERCRQIAREMLYAFLLVKEIN